MSVLDLKPRRPITYRDDYSNHTVSMRRTTSTMGRLLYRIGFLRYFRMGWRAPIR